MTFQRLRVSINCGIETQQQLQQKPIIMDFAARHAYLIQSPTVKGTFSFRFPLKPIFGFCEDYDKIVYGLKHSRTSARKTDYDAIFNAAVAHSGKVSLDKISFFMPHDIPGDTERFSICKTIAEHKNSSRETEIYYCWIPNG